MQLRTLAIGCICSLALPAAMPRATAQTPAPASRIASLDELSGSVQTLSRRVSPAVVRVVAMGYGAPAPSEGAAAAMLTRRSHTGAGVILDPRGYIVTNAHVVTGAESIRVALAPPPHDPGTRHSIVRRSAEMLEARLVGLDSETDLAVLKIEGEGYPHLRLGDSDRLRQAQLVLAFGSPLGLENSVSLGVVSSVARQLHPESPMVYIQTDAAINPGNSGGPLVNAEGEVVGINSLILSQSGGSEGIGFAIPSNIVSTVFRQIRAGGRVRRGVIGVRAQTIDATLAEGLGLQRQWGVILSDVFPGGPAARAGLAAGDVVLTLDGKPMENGRQFGVDIYGKTIGETAKITVMRADSTLTIEVPVLERPENPDLLATRVNPERNLIARLGVLGLTLDRELAAALPPYRHRSGVVVAARPPNRALGGRGFMPGDLIVSVNRVPVGGLATLRSVLERLRPGQAAAVQIERRGQLEYLAFPLP